MIVLVDTSVWIRFLSNRAAYAAELDRLLSRDEVSGHDLVYGELLTGIRAGGNSCWPATSKCIRRPW
jgi:predicted nucleic acid-binding protein